MRLPRWRSLQGTNWGDGQLVGIVDGGFRSACPGGGSRQLWPWAHWSAKGAVVGWSEGLLKEIDLVTEPGKEGREERGPVLAGSPCRRKGR